MGSDVSGGRQSATWANFNPRSPCGERPPPVSLRLWSRYFNPRSPCGERRKFSHVYTLLFYFNPRSPCGERRFLPRNLVEITSISIHAPRVGSDCSAFGGIGTATTFQSTLPVWGATSRVSLRSLSTTHFNPRSPCGERPQFGTSWVSASDFNPRSPCGERPVLQDKKDMYINLFQSTLPVWGATGSPYSVRVTWTYFNPRSPCGERPVGVCSLPMGSHFNPRSPCGERRQSFEPACIYSLISIHAPRVGSDRRLRIKEVFSNISIHAPRVGSDTTLSILLRTTLISIHAPRVGSDGYGTFLRESPTNFNPRSPCGERPTSSGFASAHPSYFNPRSPCGERLWLVKSNGGGAQFQSTLPVWGATYFLNKSDLPVKISIHAPRVGSDERILRTRYAQLDFNPRSPCGERPWAVCQSVQ